MKVRWNESWWARLLALVVTVGAPGAWAQQDSGCADGQREGFVDQARYPNIAGCSGGWSIPGVLVSTPGVQPYCPERPLKDTREPACRRAAGDDGRSPRGEGCNVEDLCAPGWHVCADAHEVEARSPTGCAGATGERDAALFFLTRQSGTGFSACATGTSKGPECASNTGTLGCKQTARTSNDLFGCGNLGATPGPSCGVLDRFSHDACLALEAPWECGRTSEHCEAQIVRKPHPDRGGVLCCRGRVKVTEDVTPVPPRGSDEAPPPRERSGARAEAGRSAKGRTRAAPVR